MILIAFNNVGVTESSFGFRQAMNKGLVANKNSITEDAQVGEDRYSGDSNLVNPQELNIPNSSNVNPVKSQIEALERLLKEYTYLVPDQSIRQSIIKRIENLFDLLESMSY